AMSGAIILPGARCWRTVPIPRLVPAEPSPPRNCSPAPWNCSRNRNAPWPSSASVATAGASWPRNTENPPTASASGWNALWTASLDNWASKGQSMSEPSATWKQLLAHLRQHRSEEWLAMLRADQYERWTRGERLPAETYLTHLSDLAFDDDTVVDLIYSEVLL